jgi:hypothetical protein
MPTKPKPKPNASAPGKISEWYAVKDGKLLRGFDSFADAVWKVQEELPTSVPPRRDKPGSHTLAGIRIVHRDVLHAEGFPGIPKRTKGGSQPGAGRPRTNTVGINIRVSADTYNWLRSQGLSKSRKSRNTGKIIDRLVHEAMARGEYESHENV